MTTARTTAQTPGRRRRSESKQLAILDAAQALFVTEGYELTSVDAVAARAGVSKRTVYDHFGDKQSVFRHVLERVNDSLTKTVRAAIDEEITTGRDLRAALTAFARRLVTEAFASSDYAVFRRLTAQGSPALQLPQEERDRPEQMLEERFSRLVTEGAIRTVDTRRAVREFTALTFLLALDALRSHSPADAAAEIDILITEGVDTFLRAYSV